MSEKTEASNSPALNSDATRVDRRGAIGRGLKLLGGLAGTLALQQSTETEARVKEKAIKTQHGIFYPLYEKHDVGRNIDDVSRPINGYFKEAKPRYEFNASERLQTKEAKTFHGAFSTKESTGQPAWPTDLLEKLARENAPIILGDIEVPNVSQLQQQLLFNSYLETTKTALGLISIGAQIIGNRRQNEQLTRREFLRETYKAAAVWTGLMLGAVPWLTRGPLAAAVSIDPEQKAPITRVLTRLHGIINHFSPEDQIIFFRNLIMANNLLLAARQIKEQKGTLPKIAFNVGAAHAGIEDFLQIGSPIIRWIIDFYPKEYLESIIDLNGGLEDFCSVRVLTLPQNFTGQKEDYNAVTDQKITDGALLKQLKQKLPEYWAKEQEAKRLETQEKAEEQRLGEEKRTSEVAKLREIFSYYTTPEVKEQLDKILDQLVVSRKDYEHLVKVDTVAKDNTTSYYITLALPQLGSEKPSTSRDVEANIVETSDGRVVSEQIEFYLDKNGKLTNWPDDDTITAPSDEELHQLLDSAVPLAKNPPGTPILSGFLKYEYKDEQGWQYYHISRGEGGKGFVGEFEDGNIRRRFIAQINGRVRVSAGVWPKEEIEKGVSTR